MNLEGAPAFSPEDHPDVPELLLERLTEAFDELYTVLQSVPESVALEGKIILTDGSGSAYLDLKNPLPQRPVSVLIGELRPDDGSPIATAQSATWFMTNEAIRVLFIGLAASSKYVCTVLVR